MFPSMFGFQLEDLMIPGSFSITCPNQAFKHCTNFNDSQAKESVPRPKRLDETLVDASKTCKAICH